MVAALGDSLTVSTEPRQARAPAKPCAESTLPPHCLCVWLALVRTHLCQALKHSQAARGHHQAIYNALPSALPQSRSNTTSPRKSHIPTHTPCPIVPKHFVSAKVLSQTCLPVSGNSPPSTGLTEWWSYPHLPSGPSPHLKMCSLGQREPNSCT